MKEFTSLEELSQLVTVRTHLFELLNGTRNVIKKGEVGQISALVQRLDAQIVHSSLELFKDEVAVDEELDIAKKVAEAKAKMAQHKGETLNFAGRIVEQPLVQRPVPVKEVEAQPEVAAATAVEVQKPTKRTFKRVNKDEPTV